MATTITETPLLATDALTPRQIVVELDKYVIGQMRAKRAVAIALRNRMRRQIGRASCRERVFRTV